MLTKRIIACLDVHGGRVVKGVQFVDLVDAGDPASLARAMPAREPTRLCCSISRRRTRGGRRCWIRCARTARELFVPFTVGGGIAERG